METRVEKNASYSNIPHSRASRNEQLYKDINKMEYETVEVKSNATVLGDSRQNIDVDKIKSILDTHYHDAPKRKTIAIEKEPEEVQNPIFETKEYDINVVINKAKDQKKNDYEEDKHRKLSETQFDLLKDLDEEPVGEEKAITEHKSKELESLINTININEKEIEKAKVQADELTMDIKDEEKTDSLDETDTEEDLFASLLGSSDDTQVLSGADEEESNELNEEINNLVTEDVKIDINSIEKEEKKKETQEDLDNSFFTKSNALKKHDFEDFKDIEEEEESSNKFVKFFIIILLIIFIIGIIILVKSFI